MGTHNKQQLGKVCVYKQSTAADPLEKEKVKNGPH